MACPSKNAILRGFFFVIAVLIFLLCERWMLLMKVMGTPTYQPHRFRHTFLLWTVKQFLRASLYLVWKAIDRNWMGMKRFQHAEVEEDTDNRRRLNRVMLRQDSMTHAGPSHTSVNTDSEDASLIQTEPTTPKTWHKRNKKSYTIFLFLLPSLFNQTHILFVFFGLRLTYPSSVIMLTGSAGAFVTLLSLAFLAKEITSFMWVGVFFTTVGFAISGLSDYFNPDLPHYGPYSIAAGDLLYTMGQITMTTQMVYEEKFMRKLSIHPMKFLGAEGIYDMVFASIMLLVFCISDTHYSDLPNNRFEDIADAVAQLAQSWQIIVAVIGSLLSYVVYTYLGMILIKDHGAMARIMIEALAWCLCWIILVSVGWESYYITQFPGFVIIPVGVLIFLHIVRFPCSRGIDTLDPYANETINIIGRGAEDNTVEVDSERIVTDEAGGAVGGPDVALIHSQESTARHGNGDADMLLG